MHNKIDLRAHTEIPTYIKTYLDLELLYCSQKNAASNFCLSFFFTKF